MDPTRWEQTPLTNKTWRPSCLTILVVNPGTEKIEWFDLPFTKAVDVSMYTYFCSSSLSSLKLLPFEQGIPLVKGCEQSVPTWAFAVPVGKAKDVGVHLMVSLHCPNNSSVMTRGQRQPLELLKYGPFHQGLHVRPQFRVIAFQQGFQAPGDPGHEWLPCIFCCTCLWNGRK